MTKPEWQDIADVDLRALADPRWYWVRLNNGVDWIMRKVKGRFFVSTLDFTADEICRQITHIAGPITPPEMPEPSGKAGIS